MIRTFLFFSAIFFSLMLTAQNDEPQTLHTPTGDLQGSLIVPAGQSRFDLMILQAGSGPTDRNGNSPLGVSANSYRLLANVLAKEGVATLLIDKRGIAASKAAGKDESALVFDNYIEDMAAWATQLKTDRRVKKIILAGHSEGSLIAMIAAQKVKADKYISIAGPSKPINEILSWQLNQRAPILAPAADSIMNKMKNGEKVDSIPPMLFSLFRPSIQPYMISWMKYNPCEEIKKLSVPVLIIQGTTDLQVQQSEGEALHQCNPASSLSIINGMNHVLKDAPAEMAANMATYKNADLPLSEKLVADIVKFIKE